jgi:hypothetical protein
LTLPSSGGEHDGVRFGGQRRRPPAWLLLAFLLCGPAAADSRGHRALAERAERVGRWADAAREYAAAFEEERAPELLYRLGIARRRVRSYAAARDAFRAYLREAPGGALKDEAERQLAQLDVILEEERRHAATPGRPRRPARDTSVERAPTPTAPSEPTAASISFTPVTTTIVNPSGSPLASAAAPPPAPPSPSWALVPVEPRVPVLAAAPLEEPSRSRRLVPWIAAGTGIAVAAGAAFWWDGSRVARDLDARFAAGELATSDGPRYGRSKAESIAGRVLIGAALCGVAAAVIAW